VKPSGLLIPSAQGLRCSRVLLATLYTTMPHLDNRSSTVAGIVDCRFSIADGHWKELPHHFFNRQSSIDNRQLEPGLPRRTA
jgi:hypothetical protein